MSEVVSLETALAEISKIENELRKGGVVVLPIEGSYIYVADAFNTAAVKKIHTLRGDDQGVAAAVAIGSLETLHGIGRNISEDLLKLAAKFWPGLMVLYIQPNAALNWDLGDGGELGEFAVRIPESKILKTLATNIGPLAFAAAAQSGKGSARNLDEVSALIGEINLYVDGGQLSDSKLSTVVRSKIIGLPDLEVVRVGAISLESLREIVPAISLASPN